MASLGPQKYFGIVPYIEQAAERIERYFKSGADEALVIGVFGEWRSGKSTMLAGIKEKFPNSPRFSAIGSENQVTNEQTLRVEFSPWRFEREEHPIIPLLKTVEKVLSDFSAANETVADKALGAVGLLRHWWRAPVKGVGRWDWLRNRTLLVANCALALTKMVKIKATMPMLGEVEVSPYDALKSAQEQIDRAEKELAQLRRQSKWDSLYYDIHNRLREVTRGNSSEPQKLNFVFLIDDLDRCLLDKAVEMLEAIKLFLDVPGCAFVLALDDEVVERGIAHRYRDYLELADRAAESIAYSLKPQRYREYLTRFAGMRMPPITGHEYLEKIVHVPFRLPRWSQDEVQAFLRQQYPQMFALAPSTKTEVQHKRMPNRAYLHPRRAKHICGRAGGCRSCQCLRG